MIKTRIIKVKSIENEKIMAITMTKLIITTEIMKTIIMMMMIRVKIDNRKI